MTVPAREQLARLLAAQDEVAASVQLAARPPGDLRVDVEGLGRLTLPVPDDEAGLLSTLAHPARFGRREETLTDTSVRDTWEVPRELVSIGWRGRPLDADLDAVRDELGLPEHCRLEAELHALLVYEPGQFFLPHQDSEKADGMIATLVVTLPSQHAGGELVVHHLGEETVYRGSPDRIMTVAFYADCRHEVRPVTSGHRVTVTYNLFLRGDSADRASDEATVAEAARLLRAHVTTPTERPYLPATEPPTRLAFLLDHEYSARSLARAQLKGTDASRAALLRAAAEAAGFEAVLGLVEIQETRDAEEPGWWPDDEADEPPGGDAENAATGELIDTAIVVTAWADATDETERELSLRLDDAAVCAVTPSSALTPQDTEFEPYMGNYGNTVDRWYRRAAVVVWPRELAFANRAEAAPTWAMRQLVAQAHAEDPASARDTARTVAPVWDDVVRATQRRPALLTATLAAAVAVDDEGAAATLLRPFGVVDLQPAQAVALVDVAHRYGDAWLDGVLDAWFGRAAPAHLRRGPGEAWFASLPDLSGALAAVDSGGVRLAQRLVTLGWDDLQERWRRLGDSPAELRELERLGPSLGGLLRSAGVAGDADLLSDMIEACRRGGDRLGASVLGALRATAPADPDDMLSRLAADQVARLRARLAQPPRADDDWSVPAPADGDRCDLCRTLEQFLTDPARRVFEWPIAQEKRKHVHQRIERAELPVTHHTLRTGSPFTLVLTKSADLFEREQRQRDRDHADLGWLLQHWPDADR